jgi:excisionase family DNA binding protein
MSPHPPSPKDPRHTRRKSLLLRVLQAAEFLGVSRATFYRLDRSGLVPAPIRLGGSRRWHREHLRSWMDAGCPTRQTWERIK